MFDFHEKRKLQQILYSQAFLWILCIPVCFVAYVAWNAYSTAQETRVRRVELAAELARLEERSMLLERDLANLDDPRGVEAALRKRYEVGKEGEELIILVAEDKPESAPTLIPEKAGWWERVKGWF